ncbi:amino acid permease [Actinomadura macrotermitis]|uniref:L-methionine/branched-chain amino acid exporter YjeH n=1 Tax=Actinomadura macrotermitis TaxID=2585200 RepID=A0A7K0BVG1_9ACTN|nr:amino acid permease [Actinomadura macrotermitis]MQY05170.1 L-methionine/branched-chain amino acid exporter YjeH [Actinomadura macrotermitis]
MSVQPAAPPAPLSAPAPHRLGLGQGTALFVGALLGPGILALPHLAVAAAGPAALVAWAALLLLSVPVAFTFAALGARFPDGGGVATFAGRAFGPRAAGTVGWWFFAAVPVGTLAGAMIGGEYVAASLGLGRAGGALVALGLLAAAFAANHGGLRMSGRVQLALVAALTVLLVVAVAAAAPDVRGSNFTPFAPHGVAGIAQAAGVLFFAFAGWEAASHLSGDFEDPERLLPRATGLTLVIVAVLHLGLAVTVIGALGGEAATSPVPIGLLMERGIGGAAGAASAVAALVLSFVAMNTYIAGGARLGAALARDGALPGLFARGRHRSLLLLEGLTVPVFAVVLATGLGLDGLMRATAACLAAVTLAGVAAATRLLHGRGRLAARVATAFTAVVVLSCGLFLLVPAALAALYRICVARRILDM